MRDGSFWVRASAGVSVLGMAVGLALGAAGAGNRGLAQAKPDDVEKAPAANEAIVRSYSEDMKWFADGETVYRVYVSVDNTPLGEKTQSVEFSNIDVSSNLSCVDYGKVGVSRDFFEGFSTFDIFYDYGVYTGRGVWSQDGPENKEGDVAYFDFVVSPSAQIGQEVRFEFVDDVTH